MKNLFLIGSMLLFFSYAQAQDTPAKTKQSTTKTDSVHKKTKKTTTTTSTTQKADTISQRNKQKKSKMKTSGGGTTQQKDSVNGTSRP